MSTDRTRPDLDDATVEALGKLSEALEVVEHARGLLYGFHRLTGTADLTRARTELAEGDRHVHEARMKQRERMPGHPTHQAGPDLPD